MNLATAEDLDVYRDVYNPPEPPIEPGCWPGSTYNAAVGEAAEQETWNRYLPDGLPRNWQQPYDGVIATKNGKDTGFAEGLRQVQVKTRTWEKKSGGHNYYNITLASHHQMASDGFYHFWVHTVADDPAVKTEDPTRQADLWLQPVDDDNSTCQQHTLDEEIEFHGDAVFTWNDIDTLITYAKEQDVTGTGFSTDSHDNPRVDIGVPLVFAYKDALQTARDAYGDDMAARQDAIRRIDDAATAAADLEDITFYS